MPFRLAKAFSPSYKVLSPVEQADEFLLQLAEWDTGASVEITNEPGRTFKVGFVQVMYENEILATYESNFLRVTSSPIPVRDGDHGLIPFYEVNPAVSPEVDGAAGTVTVEPTIYDSPEDPFDWYRVPSPVPSNPIIALQYRLKFRTWLVVRDITAAPFPNTFEAVLAQFNYVLEAKFNIDVTRPVGSRCGLSDSIKKSNKPELVNPPTPIHACAWKALVANDCLNEVWTPRTVVKSSNAPVGPVTTGVSVQNRINQFGGS
jgi:hypothetical protein